MAKVRKKKTRAQKILENKTEEVKASSYSEKTRIKNKEEKKQKT